MQLSTERLCRRMELAQVTAAKLAEQAGISRQAMYNIMNGKSQPKPETLRAICEALGCRAEALYGYESGPYDHVRAADTIVERVSREGHGYDVEAAVLGYIGDWLASTYSDLDREQYAKAKQAVAGYGADLAEGVATMMRCFDRFGVDASTQKRAVSCALVEVHEVLPHFVDEAIGAWQPDGVDIFEGMENEPTRAEDAEPRMTPVEIRTTGGGTITTPVEIRTTGTDEFAERLSGKGTAAHMVYSFKPKRDE